MRAPRNFHDLVGGGRGEDHRVNPLARSQGAATEGAGLTGRNEVLRSGNRRRRPFRTQEGEEDQDGDHGQAGGYEDGGQDTGSRKGFMGG